MSRHTYDYGLIGNCGYLALIGKDTNVGWMCLPKFDSTFVFGSLIAPEKGGEFSIKPASGEFTTNQYYVENTNVLITEVHSDKGSYRVTDFAPRFPQYDRHYRPLMLVRKIEPIDGIPIIKVKCEPVCQYGEFKLKPERGSNHIRYYGMDESMRLSTDVPLNYILKDRPFVLTDTRYMVLSYGAPLEAPLRKTVENFYRETVSYWQGWVKSTSIGNLYQTEVIRSSLALKIHQFEDTGGIIASPTMSLPESPGSTRNWDYRYCWMRDAFYTLTAYNNIGHFEEMEKYFQYLTNIPMADDDRIQPLWSINGKSKLIENELPLKGYLGNTPVRVGNDAHTHIQNDVYGQILMAILPLFIDKRFVNQERSHSIQLVNTILDGIERTMDEPDAGLWEFRNKAQYHAYSFLFQWAGSGAAAKIAETMGDKAMLKRATSLMARAKVYIEACYDSERKVYTQAKGVKHLDASTLQLILMGYIDPNSQRAKDHLKVMEQELSGGNGLFYRYKHADDFGQPETTFMICAYWYVETLAAVGRLEEAQEYFEHLYTYSNHVGLLSEDVEAATGSQWGNFPQAYSHVGLVNAAYRIHKKLNKPSFM